MVGIEPSRSELTTDLVLWTCVYSTLTQSPLPKEWSWLRNIRRKIQDIPTSTNVSDTSVSEAFAETST